MDTANTYCVEYSISQQCFHIGVLADTLVQNQISAEESRIAADYKILAICEDYVHAKAIARMLDALYEKKGVKERNRRESTRRFE